MLAPPDGGPPAAAAGGAWRTTTASVSSPASSSDSRFMGGTTSSGVAQWGETGARRGRGAVPVGRHDPDLRHHRVAPELAPDQLVGGRARWELRLDRSVALGVDPGRGDRADRVEEESVGLPGELLVLEGLRHAGRHGAQHQPAEDLVRVLGPGPGLAGADDVVEVGPEHREWRAAEARGQEEPVLASTDRPQEQTVRAQPPLRPGPGVRVADGAPGLVHDL